MKIIRNFDKKGSFDLKSGDWFLDNNEDINIFISFGEYLQVAKDGSCSPWKGKDFPSIYPIRKLEAKVELS